MSDPFVVRRLVAADVEDYRDIRLAALEMEPIAFGSGHAIEASRPIEAHARRLTSSIVFGAYEDGRIVGVIGLKQGDGPKAAHKGLVWGFYVDPRCRKRGVGAALVSGLLMAARRVVEQVMLSVVAENTAAIALYENFGFARYGVEPRALKTQDGYWDEVLMVLFLDAHASRPCL